MGRGAGAGVWLLGDAQGVIQARVLGKPLAGKGSIGVDFVDGARRADNTPVECFQSKKATAVEASGAMRPAMVDTSTVWVGRAMGSTSASPARWTVVSKNMCQRRLRPLGQVPLGQACHCGR